MSKKRFSKREVRRMRQAFVVGSGSRAQTAAHEHLVRILDRLSKKTKGQKILARLNGLSGLRRLKVRKRLFR